MPSPLIVLAEHDGNGKDHYPGHQQASQCDKAGLGGHSRLIKPQHGRESQSHHDGVQGTEPPETRLRDRLAQEPCAKPGPGLMFGLGPREHQNDRQNSHDQQHVDHDRWTGDHQVHGSFERREFRGPLDGVECPPVVNHDVQELLRHVGTQDAVRIGDDEYRHHRWCRDGEVLQCNRPCRCNHQDWQRKRCEVVEPWQAQQEVYYPLHLSPLSERGVDRYVLAP